MSFSFLRSQKLDPAPMLLGRNWRAPMPPEEEEPRPPLLPKPPAQALPGSVIPQNTTKYPQVGAQAGPPQISAASQALGRPAPPPTAAAPRQPAPAPNATEQDPKAVAAWEQAKGEVAAASRPPPPLPPEGHEQLSAALKTAFATPSPGPATPGQGTTTPPAQAPQPRNMMDTLTGNGRSMKRAIDLSHSALGVPYPSATSLTPDASGTSYAISHAGKGFGVAGKPYATYDAGKKRVVLQGDGQGGLGEDARHYLQHVGANQSPGQLLVYYPGNQAAYSAAEVQGLHQTGEQAIKSTAEDSPERAAALARAGLSPEGIQQQYKGGRLSYQQATALNQKFNGVTEVNASRFGSQQGLGAWAADKSNPHGEWFRNGTPEQKAVAVNKYYDDLAAKAKGNLHADPERIEMLRRDELGRHNPDWKVPGSTSPGQALEEGPARFESIPLKDGGHALLPGGRWTEEDLAKAHENPVFARATQAERDAVMNDISAGALPTPAPARALIRRPTSASTRRRSRRATSQPL